MALSVGARDRVSAASVLVPPRGEAREGWLRALASARLSMVSGPGRRSLRLRPGPGKPWPARAALNRPAAAAVAALPGVRAPLQLGCTAFGAVLAASSHGFPNHGCFKRGEVSYLKARKCFKGKCQFCIAIRVGAVHCKMGNFLCFTEYLCWGRISKCEIKMHESDGSLSVLVSPCSLQHWPRVAECTVPLEPTQGGARCGPLPGSRGPQCGPWSPSTEGEQGSYFGGGFLYPSDSVPIKMNYFN